MKNSHELLFAAALAAAVLVLTGCDRGPSLSEIEAKERRSRLYTNAMDDLQAGRMDAAIKGFERVVLDDPRAYSAHFQLATLLQDVRKDYVGAIAHYRAYLALRPASDKATVAQDRASLCDTLLSAQYVRKAGGSASEKIAADNEKLTAECAGLTAQVKKLTAELDAAKKEVAKLTKENDFKRKMLAKLGEEMDGASGGSRSVAASAKEALAELKKMEREERRRRVNPTDAELLDEDDTPHERLADTSDVKKLVAEAKQEERRDRGNPLASKPAAGTENKAKGSSPAGAGAFDGLLVGGKQHRQPASRPETYTVQEGDTLFKISNRFYGNSSMWRKIRNANLATVPADGRLRAGQVLKLP